MSDSKIDPSGDSLGMRGNNDVVRLLRKHVPEGEASEVVIYSNFVIKINKRGKEQRRALLLTDKGIYNLMPKAYGTCKRRIALDSIMGITNSTTSEEFVVHIPNEYDYRFKMVSSCSLSILFVCFNPLFCFWPSACILFSPY